METLLFLLTFAISAGMIPLIIYLSHRFSLLDKPNERKIHTHSISRLGGVAIITAVAIAYGICLFKGYLSVQSKLVTVVLVGGSISFVFGFLDDLKNISYKYKLAFQIILAISAFYLGFRIESIQLEWGRPFSLGWLSLPVTMFWIIMMMNAFNMIDGLDGLAGGTALIVFSTLAIVGYTSQNQELMLMSLMFAAGCLGFLVFNFHPAKIFMGDAGSMTLGCVLAILTVSSGHHEKSVNFFTPLFFLAFPLIDLFISILRRMIYAKTTEKGIGFFGMLRRTFDADDNHIHHRLLKLGLSQRKIALIIYAFTIISCGLGLASVYFSFGLIFFLFIFYVWFTVQSIRLLDYEEFVMGSYRSEKKEFEEKKKLSTAPSFIKKVL